jgi:hypothetical protein
MKYRTFQEFWPKYLEEHSSPLNQKLHFIGTSLALTFLISSIVLTDGFFLICAVVAGYLFAWFGHLFVQKNRPLTFQYPIKSLFADFKLYLLLWRLWVFKIPLS